MLNASASSPGSAPALAGTASAFVDAIGVNVHLISGASGYSQFAQVRSLLEGLGVHHIRDGAPVDQPWVCSEDVALAAAGIRADVITPAGLDTAKLQASLACLGSAVDAVEGPNEYDASGDGNWPAVVRADMQALYAIAKPVSVIAPALTSEQSFATLGSIASLADAGNVHSYMAGRNPESTGWGGTDAFGTYGSLAFNLNLAAHLVGSKPVVATETGYSDDGSDQYAVPPSVKMDYTLRTLLNDWNAGVARTYLYELIDEGPPPFSHYGLADAGGNPKPAYTALKNFIAHIADTNGAFTPVPLDYALSAPASVGHTLLARHDGSYQLILWVDSPEWDPTTSSLRATDPQTVSLTFGRSPSALRATTFDANGNATTSALQAGAPITVTGTPAIVDIVP